MLDDITPVILTFNEVQNIERTLSGLTWARDIVVVDSNSDDGTLDILARWPSVRVFRRAFDTHGRQWRYAVEETAIRTGWILRLDADYQVPSDFIAEMRALDLSGPVNAYRAGFDYEIFSRRLGTSLYPANTVLLRRGSFSVYDDGHTERWSVEGPVGEMQSRLIHADRKPLGRWVASQSRYMTLEATRLDQAPRRVAAWLRRHPPLMPIAAFLYCLFGKGLLLNGRAGLHYALQRLVAESLLALMVVEKRLRRSESPDPSGRHERTPSEADR